MWHVVAYPRWLDVAVSSRSSAKAIIDGDAGISRNQTRRRCSLVMDVRQRELRVKSGVSADGGIVVAVAIDYGIWDREAAAWLQRKEFWGAEKMLLLAGKLSQRARAALNKAGWKVKTGLRG